MKSAAELAADQAAFWNGPGGKMWLASYERIQKSIEGFSAAALAAAAARPNEQVLDVGCGTGTTTGKLAAAVGSQGHVLGVDISEPLIEAARAQNFANATFAVGDATIYPFGPETLDLVFSRFGVMFFADPVGAFANLRRALTPGGRAVFACWRAAKLNSWQMTPLRAALRHVPRLPEHGPEDPGPFSFADEARVRRVLGRAGFAKIELAPIDLEIDIAAGQGFESAMATAQSIGAASRAMEGRSELERAAAVEEIRAALAPLRRGDTLPLGAAVWIVTAVNP